MDRPVSRTLTSNQAKRLRAALEARGHVPARHPKNPHVEFEVRTDGRSIFTYYRSGKLVSTVRSGDAEGILIEIEIEALAGAAPSVSGRETVAGAGRGSAAGIGRGTRDGLVRLAGIDETGTGELLGAAVVGGACLPVSLTDTVVSLFGHVDTKSSRAASGWESLGVQIAELAEDGLIATTLAIPNRLFDRYSKNGLLDLAYVRVAGDLFAAAGLRRGNVAAHDGLAGFELLIDDYGIGASLTEAVTSWRGAGAHVVVQTKADDEHIAARVASVAARSHRSREMVGLAASVSDGPIGTGNAGHAPTLRWLAGRARRGGGWPSFVKASFRTVRDLSGMPAVKKLRVPAPDTLLDADAARDFAAGRLDVSTAALLDARGKPMRRVKLDDSGAPVGSTPGVALDLLPLLCGGLVPDETIWTLDTMEPLLHREEGLLSGWRVLIGPDVGVDDAVLVALARAHRAGVLTLVRTRYPDPLERARRHAAVLLSRKARRAVLCLQLIG